MYINIVAHVYKEKMLVMVCKENSLSLFAWLKGKRSGWEICGLSPYEIQYQDQYLSGHHFGLCNVKHTKLLLKYNKVSLAFTPRFYLFFFSSISSSLPVVKTTLDVKNLPFSEYHTKRFSVNSSLCSVSAFHPPKCENQQICMAFPSKWVIVFLKELAFSKYTRPTNRREWNDNLKSVILRAHWFCLDN